MLLCRCDSDHAEFISSVLDPRDHPYVMGATRAVEPFVSADEAGKRQGKDDATIKAEWKVAAGLMTFDEAVKMSTTEAKFQEYLNEVGGKVVALQDRRRMARDVTGSDIYFDWELPRTKLGQYRWQWSTKAVIERCILAAPLGDVTWSRQDKPNKKDMHDFHSAVKSVFPNRLFAFGYMGAYDFQQGGYSPDEVESFPRDIARDYSVCWQVQPIWATQGLSLHARQFARMFREKGIAGYMKEVAAPAIAEMATDKYGKPTARGGYLADAFFDVVAGDEITNRV